MEILGEKINFKDNLAFSLKRYRVWWAILLVTMVFDYITTLDFIPESGLVAEANPIARWLIGNLGLAAGTFIAKSLQLVSVVVFAGLHRRLGNLFLLIVIVLNCWAVVVNTF